MFDPKAVIHPVSPRAYSDPAHFERERRVLLEPNWLAVAHVSQLQEPGCYVAADLHGTPIVVVKQKDGSLGALSNVCKHRAYPIMRGCGKARALTCPYHAWTYDLDGRLRSAPYMESTPGFDAKKVALPTVRTEVWKGLVFATLNPDAAPLAPQLAGLTDYTAKYDLEGMRVVADFELDHPWNWKIMAENFSEGYHHSTQHRESIPEFPTSSATCPEPDDGPYWIWESHGRPNHPGHHLLGIGIFPYTLISFSSYKDRQACTWLHLQQLEPRYHRCTLRTLVNEAYDAHPRIIERMGADVPAFHREDMEICLEAQRGLASSLAAPPTLCHQQEAVIERFHRWINEQFANQR